MSIKPAGVFPALRVRGLALAATVALTLAAAPTSVVAAELDPRAAVSAAAIRNVGDVVLRGCSVGGGSWCGSRQVALDYRDRGAGTITVSFAWFPATGSAQGTIVAMEGGPGYPSTRTASSFLALFAPLLATRNLLLVDARGTGRSTPIDCQALQAFTGDTATDAYRGAAAACGDQLNHTFRRADGSYVHASDLFGTANAARDVAAIIGALRLGKVDLYGDSYGTYFAQTFASRYPQLLRSVTLDAAYEVVGLNPWYTTTVTSARAAFDFVCRQSAACAKAAPGSSWARITALADRLRRSPVSGWTVGVLGQRVYQRVDVRGLVDMVNDAGYDYGVYRDLDAAARALLVSNDRAPLLRQLAQDIGYDDADYVGDARKYSDGLYVAVACTDYPQLFNMNAAPGLRRYQLAAAEKALPPATFAPFTVAEWIQVNTYTEDYTGCLDWPAPIHHDAPVVKPVPLVDSGVPVLVLSGSIDSLTPAQGGARVARQIGKSARFVEAVNMVHLVGLGDRFGCGSSLVETFLADPELLQSMDTSCTHAIPEVRAVGSFPLSLASVSPAGSQPGSTAGTAELRLAAVATATVGDAVERWTYMFGSTDLALRGGSLSAATDSSGVTQITLRDARFVTDVALNGQVQIAADGLTVSAQVTASGGQGPPLALTISWDGNRQHAVATMTGPGLRAVLPAP